MRVYGRITNEDGTKTWVVVQTNAQGFNDLVYLTALAQVLKLNLGESPFWANYGIPAQPSVVQQVFPDFYVSFTQQRYAGYFASLIIAKVPGTITPIYNITATTQQGVVLNAAVPIPT